MRLWAISDVHLAYAQNRAAFAALPEHPEDWLILAGDICERREDLAWALDVATARFARVVWVPGNHELWTTQDAPDLRGQDKYEALVELCRARGVLTPEDPFARIEGKGGPVWIAPLFVLYDYSFRPDEVPIEGAVAWAAESGIMCADEQRLDSRPFPSKRAWCEARLAYSRARLEAAHASGEPLVMVNHFPLRRDLVFLPFIPRFSVWCGTRETEDWHVRYGARIVISGHLHVPSQHERDGVRFEEVSLGYPRQWRTERGIAPHLRPIDV